MINQPSRNLSVIHSPIGKLSLEVAGSQLMGINFLYDDSDTPCYSHPSAQPYIKALNEYFKNPKHQLAPLVHIPAGTHYQQRIWQALTKIPAGQTLTYGNIANQFASGPRAVGQACRTNPLPLFIPCHRIVAANGIGGFTGKTHGKWLAIKTWLLQHEGLN